MIAVIRIAGQVKIRKKVEKTLFRLRLRKKFACTLIREKDAVKIGMLKKVKDLVAFGEIEKGMLTRLIEKRGKRKDKKEIKDAEKIAEEIEKGKSLEELGFKQYPLSVWFVMPRWRRTREVGGFILEDVINSETPNHGGYGRLKGHPGTSVIIEYQFFCIPYEELVDQPPEGKEADYRHIPSLGKYKLRHNPNGDIGLEAFNVAVEQLERDLATMFRVLKKSEVRCDYDN